MKPFDASGAFISPASSDPLRRIAVRGAGSNILAAAVGLGVQIVSTVVLARLLTPADFGLVAMVTTFSLLLSNFVLNGFTEAIIQCETLDRALASNLFWINMAAGVALTFGLSGAGFLLARLYSNPKVVFVAIGLSLSIVVTSSSVLHLALLKRAMLFPALSMNDIVASVASVVISVTLAWLGFGYWALIAGTIMRPLSQSIGAWWMCRWLPGAPRRIQGTLARVRFALSVYGRFAINYCVRNMDNLLVGWRFGPVALGFYKKAYDLFLLSASQVVNPVNVVAVSVLSRLDRESREYHRVLINALSTTAFIGMALGAALTLTGKDVIRLLLGPNWGPAGDIFRLFGPGIGIMLLYNTHSWIHLSIGTADRWLRWVLVELTVTGLLFLVGLRWGPAGIAAAWTASFWILTIPALWYGGKPIGFSVLSAIAAVWRYIVASAVSGVATALLISRVPLNVPDTNLGAALRIILASFVFLVLYVGTVSGLHRSFSPVAQLGRLLRDMVPRGKLGPLTTTAPLKGSAGT